MLFKESTIIPVQKNNLCLNDYRPVALSSVVMKKLESFVLTYFKSILSATFGPFQFAYRANRSHGDAISV